MSTNTVSASSLVFTDGFDYYNSILEKWSGLTGNQIFQTPGRFGYGQCYQPINYGGHNGQYTYKALGPYSRFVFGSAINLNATNISGLSQIMGFIDSNANPFLSVNVDALGRLNFAGLYSAPNLVPVTGWVYVEIDVIFTGAASGNNAFQLNLNGQNVLNGTNVTITDNNSSVSEAFGIAVFNDNLSTYFDDIYVLAPTTNVVGDSFLGDVKIVPLIPNGDGAINQWTQTGGVSGQNYSSVDDIPADGDNSYVSSNTPGQIDTYTTPSINSLTPVSAVYGVSVYALARKDDSPARFLSAGVGNGTTESFDAGSAVGSTYSYVQRVLPINPFTSEPWQIADFEHLQLGIKIVS